MTQRRILIRTDDGAEIEVSWTEANRKITLEFEERPAPTPITDAPKSETPIGETSTELEHQQPCPIENISRSGA